jgi:DNA replication licensing factor MCM4
MRIKKDKLMVGITDLDEETILRNLSPKQINRLISFRGIVIRCSDIHPEMKAAMFKCTICSNEVQVIL